MIHMLPNVTTSVPEDRNCNLHPDQSVNLPTCVMKSLQILNESLPLLAVRRFAILLVCVVNCGRPTFIGNNCRRYGSTLSIHRGAVRRSAAAAARRRRRDQQRAEHGNVAVRSKAVNGRTRTHSLVVLLVCARTASRYGRPPLSFRFNFSPVTGVAARALQQHVHRLKKDINSSKFRRVSTTESYHKTTIRCSYL